jgi:hypothetical protein
LPRLSCSAQRSLILCQNTVGGKSVVSARSPALFAREQASAFDVVTQRLAFQ